MKKFKRFFGVFAVALVCTLGCNQNKTTAMEDFNNFNSIVYNNYYKNENLGYDRMKNQILCHLEGDEGIESEYGKFEIFLSAVGEKDAYGRFTKYKIVATPIDEKNAKKYKTRMQSTSNPEKNLRFSVFNKEKLKEKYPLIAVAWNEKPKEGLNKEKIKSYEENLKKLREEGNFGASRKYDGIAKIDNGFLICDVVLKYREGKDIPYGFCFEGELDVTRYDYIKKVIDNNAKDNENNEDFLVWLNFGDGIFEGGAKFVFSCLDGQKKKPAKKINFSKSPVQWVGSFFDQSKNPCNTNFRGEFLGEKKDFNFFKNFSKEVDVWFSSENNGQICFYNKNLENILEKKEINVEDLRVAVWCDEFVVKGKITYGGCFSFAFGKKEIEKAIANKKTLNMAVYYKDKKDKNENSYESLITLVKGYLKFECGEKYQFDAVIDEEKDNKKLKDVLHLCEICKGLKPYKKENYNNEYENYNEEYCELKNKKNIKKNDKIDDYEIVAFFDDENKRVCFYNTKNLKEIVEKKEINFKDLRVEVWYKSKGESKDFIKQGNLEKNVQDSNLIQFEIDTDNLDLDHVDNRQLYMAIYDVNNPNLVLVEGYLIFKDDKSVYECKAAISEKDENEIVIEEQKEENFKNNYDNYVELKNIEENDKTDENKLKAVYDEINNGFGIRGKEKLKKIIKYVGPENLAIAIFGIKKDSGEQFILKNKDVSVTDSGSYSFIKYEFDENFNKKEIGKGLTLFIGIYDKKVGPEKCFISGKLNFEVDIDDYNRVKFTYDDLRINEIESEHIKNNYGKISEKGKYSFDDEKNKIFTNKDYEDYEDYEDYDNKINNEDYDNKINIEDYDNKINIEEYSNNKMDFNGKSDKIEIKFDAFEGNITIYIPKKFKTKIDPSKKYEAEIFWEDKEGEKKQIPFFPVYITDLNEDYCYCLRFNVKDLIRRNIIFNNKLTFDIHSEKDNILMFGTLNFGLDNSEEITLLEYSVDFM